MKRHMNLTFLLCRLRRVFLARKATLLVLDSDLAKRKSNSSSKLGFSFSKFLRKF